MPDRDGHQGRWSTIERRLFRRGFQCLAGCDEAGRGPLAGPVVAAAVILPRRFFLPGLDDSKRLSAGQRQRLYETLRTTAQIGVAVIGPQRIDQVNILNASLEAMAQAVRALPECPDHVLVDGLHPLPLALPQTPVVEGDRRCATISAASIVAKVLRDRLMSAYARWYPEYQFEHHKGYGTPRHLRQLTDWGPSPIHRQSFSPVRQCEQRSFLLSP